MGYRQRHIPRATNTLVGISNKKIRETVRVYYQANIQGQTVVNLHLGITIKFNAIGRDKTSHGSKMDSIKAVAAINIIDLLRIAKYNNYGAPKAKHVAKYGTLGFLNFNAKVIIDGVKYGIRIPVMVTQNGKFQYSLEIDVP